MASRLAPPPPTPLLHRFNELPPKEGDHAHRNNGENGYVCVYVKHNPEK